VGAFRVDVARAGATEKVSAFVDELCALSPEFAAMWRDNNVSTHHEGIKHIKHPVLGRLAFEFSAFAVDGRPDLTMIVYNPTEPKDVEKIRALIAVRPVAKTGSKPRSKAEKKGMGEPRSRR
jgi:hypothetical protein